MLRRQLARGVLERGRAYPPGSFTRSPYRARESFWDPPRGLTGMYHYWSFKGIDALVIPADRTSWGSFIALRELSDNRIRALIGPSSRSRS